MRSLRQEVVSRAGMPYSSNPVSLQGPLMRIAQSWPLLLGRSTDEPNCPIGFSDEEFKAHCETEEKWFECNTMLQHWQSEMGGANEEGWVRSESFEAAVERHEQWRAYFLEAAETEEERESGTGHWPFQDHEEDL